MMAQEFSERREDYQGEKRRMDDMLLKGFIDLSNRIASMETTLKEQVDTIKKYNNFGTRLVSLEEFRQRQIETCAKIQDEKERKRFPWNAVIVGIIVAFATTTMNYFIFK